MILKNWDELPEELKIPEVKPYYDILSKKRFSLLIKRIFDFLVSFIMLIILSPIFLVIAIAIKLDSKGPVFFRQTRITQYGRKFRIFKFRTMVSNAEEIGSQITVENDFRITRVGSFIRDCRLDEIPQLLNIISGDMTFVGARPEVPKYVKEYTPEMKATLLLPAGVTSLASIFYKDEADLLSRTKNVDETYINEILPCKMNYNLAAIKDFSFLREIVLMFKTILVVIKN